MRLPSYYRLTRTAFPSKGHVRAFFYGWKILRRVKRRERQEGKLPIRFEP